MYLDRDHTVCYVLLELHTIVLLVQVLVYGTIFVSGTWWYFCLQLILRSRVLDMRIIASIILGIKTESRDTLAIMHMHIKNMIGTLGTRVPTPGR